MVCISCATEHNSNFCPNCGEYAGTKKITFSSIIESAFSTITNMDRGLVYNLKMLFVNPKSILSNYINGKRRGILNPISFLILLVSLYLIAESILRVPPETVDPLKIPKDDIGKVAYATGKYVHSYFKYFWILSIIPMSLASKLLFRTYNYTEHLAINAFVLGQATFIGFLSYVILRIDMVVNPLVYLMIVWLLFQNFQQKGNYAMTALKSLGTIGLFVFQLFIIAITIGFVMA